MSPHFRTLLKFGISLACLILVWRWIDLRDLSLKLKSLAPLPLVAAMVTNLVLQLLNAIKIRLIFPPPRPALGRIVAVNFIAVFFSLFVPGGIGGEVSRWAYMSRESGSKSQALAAILLDRVTGLWAQIFLALAAWIWLAQAGTPSIHRSGLVIWITILIAIFIFAMSLGLGLWGYRGLSRGAQRAEKWFRTRRGDSEIPSTDIGPALEELLSARMRCAQVSGLSLLYQALVIGTFLLIDHSIGGSLGFAQAAIFLVGYTLIMLLPISLGNWGVSEGVLGGLYHYTSSQSETGVLISLLLRIMSLPAAGIGWILFMSNRSQDSEKP